MVQPVLGDAFAALVLDAKKKALHISVVVTVCVL